MNELKNPTQSPSGSTPRGGEEHGAMKAMLSALNKNPEMYTEKGNTELLLTNPDIVPIPLHAMREQQANPEYENPPEGPMGYAPAPPQQPVHAGPPPGGRRPVGRCLLISGRLAAGKDFVSEKADAKIFAFPEPLYAIAAYFTGVEVTSTQNKDLPGMRDLLQKIGQWGRGFVDPKDSRYFYSPERAVFTQMVRALGARGAFKNMEVDWAQFGLDNYIWVKATHKRVDEFLGANPSKRVSIPNARFEHEIKFFRELPEWDHWHVMCSKETWTERLAKKGLTPQSKEVSDVSEQIAIHLDNNVQKKLREGGSNMLRVIWNDHRPCPSRRLYTLPMFLQEVALIEAMPEIKSDIEVQ